MKYYKLLSVLFVLLSLTASRLQAQEPYAVLDNSILTFYYDNQKDARSGMDLGPFPNADYRGWNGAAKSITKVVFDSSMDSYTGLTSTAFWFWDFINLEEVVDIQYLHTDSVRSMESMFGIWGGTNYQNPITGKLPTVDMTHFNTSKVENMNGVFSNCANLTSLDLSSFDTRRVTDMSTMFAGCTSLTTINVGPYWTTAAVENSSLMFRECTSLVGGAGTTFNADYIDKTYARIDRGTASPGYLTGDAADWEPYAVLSDNNTVLTFYYDDQKTTRGGMDIGPFNDIEERGWHEARENITTVVFDDSFANCNSLTSTAYWFYACSSLTAITGIENLNTSNVTEMSGMFAGCFGLTSLDLRNFNTSNVTNMSGMFAVCLSLTSLDVSGFNISNVTNMNGMFMQCSSLTSIDLSNFNTSNVTNMNGMFKQCSSLTSLDLSNFNTSNVTDMREMFHFCSDLTSLDLSHFDTSKVNSMYYMFSGCSSLTSLDVSHFDTSNVTDMRYMFSGCSALTNLDLSHLENSKVTDMGYMFSGCSSLTSLDVSHFDTSNVIDMRYMFSGCSALPSLDLSHFDTSNVTIMDSMFAGCSNLSAIYAGDGWSTAAVTEGNDMFTGCNNLVGGAGTVFDGNYTNHTYAHIDGGTANPGYFTDKNAPAVAEAYAVLSDNNTVLTFYYDDQKSARGGMDVGPFDAPEGRGWHEARESIATVVFDDSFANCTSVTSTARWFYGCSNLTAITGIENLNTSNVTDMRFMFGYCSKLTSLDVSGFNTENVTDMTLMFFGCSGLTNLDVSHFNTSNVTRMVTMFGDCSGLTNLDLSGFNTAKVTDMNGMFYNCSGLTSLDVSSFNTENVTDMTMMFYGCSGLMVLDISNFNTSNVTHMIGLVAGCSALTTIYVGGGWTTLNVLYGDDNTTRFFAGCINLVGGAGTHFDENHTDYTYAHIDGGTANPGYFTDKNTPKVSEAYAVLSQDSTVLTFYYDNQKEERGGMGLEGGTYRAWHAYRDRIETVVFDATFANFDKLTNTSFWFFEFERLTEIIGTSNLKTDNVTDMSWMFDGCSGLTSLDVSNFNTANVTNMADMFAGCSALTTLDVSNFNTGNVMYMSSMFSSCSGLTTLDVSNFNTANVTSMGSMFMHCSSLTTLDVSNFNTSNVTEMGFMFYGCSSLTKLDVSNFNTENVTDMSRMFDGCSNVTVLDVSNFSTVNVASMYGMFQGCSSLTTLDVSRFNTEKVTSMNELFYGCSGLTTLDVSNFNTENVTNMRQMFCTCSSLTTLDVSNFDTEKVTNMINMFSGCSILTTLDVSSFNTTNVTNMSGMFWDCSALTTLDVSNFNTANVTEMDHMFCYCRNLATIYVGKEWSTANVTSSDEMFSGSTNLVGGAGTAYDANHTDNSYAHIDGGTANPGYFTDKNAVPAEDIDPENCMLAQWRQVGGKDYKLYTVVNPTEYRTNYDGTEFYRAMIVLDVISGTDTTHVVVDPGQVYLQRRDNGMVPCMMIDKTNNRMYVFTNSKAQDMYYGMDGFCYVSNLDAPAFTREQVFADANWGWYGFFTGVNSSGQPVLSHFSYAGYYDFQSTRMQDGTWQNEEVGDIMPEEVADRWLSVNKVTVVGGTETDEVTVGNITYTLRNGQSAAISWVADKNTMTEFSVPETITVGEATLDVTEIAPMALCYWNSLKQLTIPASVTRVGEAALYRNSSLEDIYVGNPTPAFLANDYGGPLYQFFEVNTDNCTLHVPENTAALYRNAEGWKEFQNIDDGAAPAIAEAYAVLSDNNTVLTFYYDDQKVARGGMSVESIEWMGDRGWHSVCESITTVIFDDSFANYTSLTKTADWFFECRNLTSVIGISNLNTSNVTNMVQMFRDCQSLTSLDLSNFNTSNVTDMGLMFAGCSSLTNLDLSSFNTENVTNMSFMFEGCSSLVNLDLSSFNTSNVTDMNSMFEKCSSLTNLDLSGFNTGNVKTMYGMFNKCSSLTNLNVNRFKTDNVNTMECMFMDCSSLINLDVSSFNTSNVTTMRYMFISCSSLKSLNLSGFNNANVKSMDSMFMGCSALADLDLSNFNTSNVTDMSRMFFGCYSLASLDLSSFNTSKVTDMYAMFENCSSLTNLDLSSFNTSNVSEMDCLFQGCSSLVNLDLSNFNTSIVADMYAMFENCSSLTSLNISSFNTSNVTDMRNMFDGCSSLTSLDVSHFNTSNVTDMNDMFSGCTSLACIQAGNAAIPDNVYAEIGNPNLLVYVNQESLAPQGIQNVVVNGTAKNIVLTDTEDGNNNFFCPVAFTAQNISYTHEYRMRTEIGVSRGWETIALPFTVQTIRHENNGLLAPFGSGLEGKPFWLRTLNGNGLAAAHSIEANVPYIISMPNNAVYPADYNQAGRVTFSAQNTVVPATERMERIGGDRVLVPTTVRVGQAEDIFAVNRNAAFDAYPEGSVFVAGYREVRPFEAYTLHPNGHARLLTIDELMEGDADFIDMQEAETNREVKVYDLSGVLVGTGRISDVMKRLPKGIYIVNGKRVVF